MLRFGIVSAIDPINVQARVSFEGDESTSFWLPIIQTKTLKDKFYSMPDIGEQVACLMDENSEDGVILGAIYSTEDVSTTQSEKQLSVNLEDGSYINADKENQTLTVAFSKEINRKHRTRGNFHKHLQELNPMRILRSKPHQCKQ